MTCRFRTRGCPEGLNSHKFQVWLSRFCPPPRAPPALHSSRFVPLLAAACILLSPEPPLKPTCHLAHPPMIPIGNPSCKSPTTPAASTARRQRNSASKAKPLHPPSQPHQFSRLYPPLPFPALCPSLINPPTLSSEAVGKKISPPSSHIPPLSAALAKPHLPVPKLMHPDCTQQRERETNAESPHSFTDPPPCHLLFFSLMPDIKLQPHLVLRNQLPANSDPAQNPRLFWGNPPQVFDIESFSP